MSDVGFARLAPDAAEHRFQRLRADLGVTLVLDGGDEHVLGTGELARVGPNVRRQLINRGAVRLELLALGGDGEHEGRDGLAYADWDEAGEGRSPAEVPLPDDE